jgi:hypothetical protein
MTITANTNITEELLYAAQKIVSFYGDSLQSEMCLVQVPISALLEAQEYIDRAQVYNDADKINGKSIDQLHKDLSDFNETPLAAAIRRRANSNCFNCKLEFPKISGKLFKDDLIGNIISFLANGNNLLRHSSFGIEKALPNLVLLLSFLCIPDLAKLLALLAARLMLLISGINLGNFNLAGFIMAIIGKILSKLFSFLNTMIEVGMSPILCIFEALKTFTDLLPKAITDISDLGTNAATGISIAGSAIKSDKMANTLNNWKDKTDGFDGFQEMMTDVGKAIPQANPIDSVSIEEQFNKVEYYIQDSINGLSEQVQNMLGLKTYFECEAKRNGTSFATEIEGVQNLIGLINLIKQIIKRKSEKTAYAQFTGAQVPSADFTMKDIAIVMSNAIDKEVLIATANNNDVGIVIGQSGLPNLDNIDIFKCNMIDFLDNSDYNQIISEAAHTSTTYGDGLEPTIPKVGIEDVFNNGDYTFVQVSGNDIDNAADKIKAIIDYLGVITVPKQNASTSNNTGQTQYLDKDKQVPFNNTGKINIANTSINIKDIDINAISTKLHQLS